MPIRRNERVIVEGAGRTGIDQNNYSWEIKRGYVCCYLNEGGYIFILPPQEVWDPTLCCCYYFGLYFYINGLLFECLLWVTTDCLNAAAFQVDWRVQRAVAECMDNSSILACPLLFPSLCDVLFGHPLRTQRGKALLPKYSYWETLFTFVYFVFKTIIHLNFNNGNRIDIISEICGLENDSYS